MRKATLCMLLGLGILVPTVIAQEITPVWEHYNRPNSQNPYFPFMVAQQGQSNAAGSGGQVPGQNNTKFEMDLVSSLIRYDANRLLLFVVENGINEDDPNHDAAMAAAYPDRTIWWINAGDGSPMGIALQPLDPSASTTFTREGTEYQTIDFYPITDFFLSRALDDRSRSFRPDMLQEEAPKVTADAEGNLYVTDRHQLLRYQPDGNGGFTGPELVYQYPQVNPPQIAGRGAGADGHFRSWRMTDVDVMGAGAQKVMTTSGRHWIDGAGMVVYQSNDGGASWEAKYHTGRSEVGGHGGGGTRIVTDTDVGEEYTITNSFPGSGDSIRRYVRGIGQDAPFDIDVADFFAYENNDPAVAGMPDPDTVTSLYKGWTKADVAAIDGIPLFVTFAIPKWKSLNGDWGGQQAPSPWLALHSWNADPNDDGIEGDFVSAHQIPWRDEDEPNIPGANFDEDAGVAWHNTYLCDVNVYVNPGYAAGAFEILVSGGGIGYARYVVGDTNIGEWSVYCRVSLRMG